MIAEQRLFVAAHGDDVRGPAGWEDGDIRHVYVDPDWFRLGIGSSLLAHAEADYRERTGRHVIEAGVILYARGFYDRHGYKLLSEAKAWDGSDYYRMRKRLAGPSSSE